MGRWPGIAAGAAAKKDQPMNPAAMQILWAFAEEIGATTTNYKGIPCCVACGDWLGRCTEDGKCSGAIARAALEAADKAPSLADDDWRGTFYTWVSSTRHRAGNWPQRALDATLDALDAYQRGGAKP